MDMPLHWVHARPSPLEGPSMDGESAETAADRRSLLALCVGDVARIAGLRIPLTPNGSDHRLVVRLLELGFVPGERVELVACGPWGGDPLAVRVGRRVFALRRDEAARVELATEPVAA